jgi:hypothetical protein
MKKTAHLNFWSGTYRVVCWDVDNKKDNVICTSNQSDPNDVIYRARKAGYDVKVYVGWKSITYKAF